VVENTTTVILFMLVVLDDNAPSLPTPSLVAATTATSRSAMTISTFFVIIAIVGVAASQVTGGYIGDGTTRGDRPVRYSDDRYECSVSYSFSFLVS
jgi:hypothetical protein